MQLFDEGEEVEVMREKCSRVPTIISIKINERGGGRGCWASFGSITCFILLHFFFFMLRNISLIFFRV